MTRFDAHGLCRLLLLCGGIALVVQCANPVAPTGGPRDETPPQLVPEASTPNQQTNFTKQDIRLTFNEWVQLRDAPSQVVISPLLENNPEITLRGKTVVYAFHKDEVLNENTTYTINFGEAVQDLTEGNPAENLVFVFSTGAFIDSLSVSGSVFNAETGKPESGIYVILHNDQSDTAITSRRPAYFARTGEGGMFRIDFMRQDTFRVYALRDANLNYLYDQEGEMFAFAPEPVYVSPGATPEIRLNAYVALPRPAVLLQQQRPAGVVKVALSRPVDTLMLNAVRGSVPDHWLVDQDTLRLWHRNADTAMIEIRHDTTVLDTIRLRPFDPAEVRRPVRVRLTGRSVHPESSLVLECATPVVAIDPARVRVQLNDSTSVSDCRVQRDTVDQRKVRLQCPWPVAGRYQVTLLQGAVTDLFGGVNDSTAYRVNVEDSTAFGSITIRVGGLDSARTYVMQLLDGQTTVKSQRLRDVQDTTLVYGRLPAKKYALRLIEDRNGNGRWDPGDFATLSQPERLLLRDLEPLRAGWDVDVTVTWTE
ncbi:MAG: Ig-like domain-containing protein [Saprospiraceae bacterium]|nr:Ig-like domain-containing protein [Saprospiraceae bacterium]